MILVARNWALGSNEVNKTSRAKSGLSGTIAMYLMGGLLNLMGLTDRPLKDVFNMSAESLAFIYLIILAVMIFAPILYLKKQFPDELIAQKVAQTNYHSQYNRPVAHLLALTFVVGGFIVLFLLPKWLS